MSVLPASLAPSMHGASPTSSVDGCYFSSSMSHHSMVSRGTEHRSHINDEDNIDDEDDISALVECVCQRTKNNHNQHEQSRISRKDNIYIDCSTTSNSLHSLRHGMKVASSHHSLYSPRCCPICYEEYKMGDDIAWSKNVECPHVYHLSCILEWLLDNDMCPMCRARYIDLNADVILEEDEEVIGEMDTNVTAVMNEFPISIVQTQVPMGDDYDQEHTIDDDDGNEDHL
jgi:hypothetical protein